MEALFGPAWLANLREAVPGLRPPRRERLTLSALKRGLKQVGGTMSKFYVMLLGFAATTLTVLPAFAQGGSVGAIVESEQAAKESTDNPADLRRTLTGTWDSHHTADFPCETVDARGTVVVVAGSRPNEYEATTSVKYRRTLKPDCVFKKPGTHREFTSESTQTWRDLGDRVLITSSQSEGGNDTKDDIKPDSRIFRRSRGASGAANELTAEFEFDGGRQRTILIQR
jgi:hypothetical protein